MTRPDSAASFRQKVEEEIIRLHRLFEDWFGGEETESIFGEIESALAEDFTMIGPTGQSVHRAPLLGGLRSARGSRPDLQIRVRNVKVLHQSTDWVLASYEEDQEGPGGTNRRTSTVLFRARDDLPNGLIWLHVHETWR